jgi:protein phosphatase
MFKLAARCEAAGRPNNEDNFLVDENLTDNEWGFTTDKTLSLGDKGALLVVCDGMGGMNAGEVASAIAVETIKQYFAKDRLTDSVTASSSSIQRYLVEAIQAADAAIKNDSTSNPEHEGMGSTIVMAWLIGQKAYVGWCGDSRAYRYNPKTGLERLSHDHSYVQELVDAGKLTEELAFDHPNNNIITRSLGDPRGKAKPDTKEYDLYDGDIILLCSDGLCGCLRDNEIEAVIAEHQGSMQDCRDTLWATDEAAGWHDNVTIVMAQILSGGAPMPVQPAAAHTVSNATLKRKNKKLKILLACTVGILLVGIALTVWMYMMPKQPAVVEETVPTDTTTVVAEQPEEEAPVVDTPKPAPQRQAPKQKVTEEEPKAPQEEKPAVIEEEPAAPQLTPVESPAQAEKPAPETAPETAPQSEPESKPEPAPESHQPQKLTPVN